MFQLVGPNVGILYPEKGFKGATIFHMPDVKNKYGLMPEQIPDYKGIAGDSSDNLPGVRGIGEKGAKDLLQKYGTLENIYEHTDELSEVVRKKLVMSRDCAFMCKNLATLRGDVGLNFDLNACRIKHFDVAAVRRAFDELGFRTLHKRIDELYGTPATSEAEATQGSLFG